MADEAETRIVVEVFLLDFVPGSGALVERTALPVPLGDPTDAAIRLVDQRRGPIPRFVHSTSWRYEPGELILTYLALLPSARLTGPIRVPLRLLALQAIGGADDPRPPGLERIDVIAHAVRHLAQRIDRGALATRGVAPYVRETLRQIRDGDFEADD